MPVGVHADLEPDVAAFDRLSVVGYCQLGHRGRGEIQRRGAHPEVDT